jgi:hypothetical protein
MKKIDKKDRKIWYIHQILVFFSILWLPGFIFIRDRGKWGTFGQGLMYSSKFEGN